MPIRALAVLIILGLLIVSIPALPTGLRLAHAQGTGIVCLADPASASSTAPCPASPYLFNGPVTLPATQLRIGLFIQGSDGLNGFSIIVIADHTVLKPAGVDLTGSVVLTPITPVVECLSGVLITGSSCSPADNIDTLDFAVAGAFGVSTTAPTTGLLFTAIYNITGTTNTPITVGFQTDNTCAPSSVAGTPPVCVTIPNGQGTDSETVATGSFKNTTPPPYLTLSASPSSFSSSAPFSGSSTITVVANNGWPGLSTDSISFVTQASPGLTASVSGTNPCNPATCATTVSLSASAAGTYSVKILGNYVASNSSGGTFTLVAVTSISVVLSDFTFTVSPTSISFPSGQIGTATATLKSVGAFAGTVALSQGTILPLTGLTVSFNPTTFVLTADASLTSTIIFSSNTPTTYHAQLKAVSGAKTKTVTSTIIVGAASAADFALAPGSSAISFSVLSVSTTDSLAVAANGGFAGTVAFTTIVTSGGYASTELTAACTSVTVNATVPSGSSTCTFASSTVGSYTVTVIGKGGSPSVSHIVTYSVTVNSANPAISTTLSSAQIGQGGSVTDSATLTMTTSTAGGTVTYEFFAGSTCSGTATIVGSPVTVTNGVVPDSASQTFPSAGSFSWNAIYSGDTNNRGVTSTCELLNVVSGPDFTLTPTSTSPAFTVLQGSGTDSLAVAGTAGFTGTVSFTTSVTSSGSASTALTASCTSVTLSVSVATGTSTCMFTSSAAGSYSVLVTGTDVSLSISHSVTYAVTVGKASPAVSTTLSSNSIIVGDSVTDSATLTGATGNAGGTVTYEFFTGSACSGTATAVGSAVTVTNGVVPSSASQPFSTIGSYSWNAVYSGDGNNTGVTSGCEPFGVVQGPDFILTPTSSILTFTVLQASVTDQLTVTAVSGFADNITFSTAVASGGAASTALAASCTSVNLKVVSAVSACTFTSSTPGSYSVVVTGTAAISSKVHRTTYSVTVNKADATISTSLSTTTINAGGSVIDSATLNGATASSGGTVTYEFFAGSTCSGAATIVGSPVTVTNGVVPDSASQTFPSAGSFSWNAIYSGDTNNNQATSGCEPLAVNDFTLGSAPTSLTITRYSNQNSTLTVTALGGFSGTVTLSVFVKPSGVAGLTTSLTPLSVSGTSTLTIRVDGTVNPGSYIVNVTATSGSIVHFVTVSVIVPPPDLLPSANPQQLNILLGSSATSTIHVTGIDGFAGTVSFSATVLSGGTIVTPLPTYSLMPKSLTLDANGSGSVVLNVTIDRSVAPGLYLVNVTMTSGSIGEFVEVFVSVPIPDFTISASSIGRILVSGVSGTSVITLTPERAFLGTVSLAVSSPSDFHCTVSPASVTLGISGSSTLSCSGTTAGIFNVTITGSGYGQTNSTRVIFTVQDFSINPSATSIALNTSVDGNVPLSITSVGGYGFEGVVSLSISATTGLKAQLNSTSLHVPGTSSLTISADTAGTYTLTVTGTNGTLSHSVTLTVNVYAPSQVFGLSQTDFYGIAGGLVILAVVGSILALRVRRSNQRKSNNRR